jgi:ABC-type lipoprotein export system ATPase subunit
MITHEDDIAKWASRVVTIRDGKIVEDRKSGRRLR